MSAGAVYISKKVTFSSAHRMFNPGLSDEENRGLYGKCANPGGHGHNYVLEVTMRGIPEERTGMVTNLDSLSGILMREIVERFDHKDLNVDVEELRGNVTSLENLVRLIWRILEPAMDEGSLYEVRLWENENNCAWYRGDGN